MNNNQNFNYNNNILLNQYNQRNLKNQNNIHQNNILLQNNQFTQQNTNQQMQYIRQMQQLRKIQLMEQMQNKIKMYTKNLLDPIKIKENNKHVTDDFINQEKIRKKEMTKNKIYDKTGNELQIDNTPYKQIMTNKKYGGEDYKKKHNKKTFTNDIVVHKVSEQDKDVKVFKEQLAEKESKIKNHNNKLKKIYADEKKEEHYKKFEYRKTYVYSKMKFSNNQENTDHNNMKKDRLEEYEKQQKEWEKDNAKVSNVVKSLKNTGILTDEQMNQTLNMLEKEVK